MFTGKFIKPIDYTIGVERIKMTSKLFEKAKEKAVAVLVNYAHGDEYYLKRARQVEALADWPTDNEMLHHVPVKGKIILLRAELAEKFPGIKFAVVKESYNSIRVTIKSPVDAKAVNDIGHKYSNSGNTDLMTDYFDYDNYVFVGEDIEIDTGVAKVKAFGLTGSPVAII